MKVNDTVYKLNTTNPDMENKFRTTMHNSGEFTSSFESPYDFSKGVDQHFSVFVNASIEEDKKLLITLNVFGIKSPAYKNFSIKKLKGEFETERFTMQPETSIGKKDLFHTYDIKPETAEGQFTFNTIDELVFVTWESRPDGYVIKNNNGSVFIDFEKGVRIENIEEYIKLLEERRDWIPIPDLKKHTQKKIDKLKKEYNLI